MRTIDRAFAVLALVACGNPPAEPAPPAPVVVAVPDAAPAPAARSAAPVASDAGAADASGGGLGGVGSVGLAGGEERCPAVPDLAEAACAPGEPASRELTRELERFLRRVAGANTAIGSERADMVRARDIHVWQLERSESRIRARVTYDADHGGTYRDTRGSRNPAPVFTGRSHHCVDLVLVRGPEGHLLERPACMPGLGFVPAFRAAPVP